MSVNQMMQPTIYHRIFFSNSFMYAITSKTWNAFWNTIKPHHLYLWKDIHIYDEGFDTRVIIFHGINVEEPKCIAVKCQKLYVWRVNFTQIISRPNIQVRPTTKTANSNALYKNFSLIKCRRHSFVSSSAVDGNIELNN